MKHTKKQQIKQAYEHYKKSNYYELSDCYGSYSTAKARAFKYCENLMTSHKGHSLKIISFNSNFFSVGFIGYIDDKEAFFYITAGSDNYIYLDEIS